MSAALKDRLTGGDAFSWRSRRSPDRRIIDLALAVI
jgi:hypothetical protein